MCKAWDRLQDECLAMIREDPSDSGKQVALMILNARASGMYSIGELSFDGDDTDVSREICSIRNQLQCSIMSRTREDIETIRSSLHGSQYPHIVVVILTTLCVIGVFLVGLYLVINTQ